MTASVLSMLFSIIIYKSCRLLLPHAHSGDFCQDSVIRRIAKLTRETENHIVSTKI